MTNRRSGLSLIEVLIAMVVLLVGVFAAVQLQAISLRNTSLADAINRVTRVVRSEIEWQRYTSLDETFELGPQTCLTPAGADDGFVRCDVIVQQCALTFPAGEGRASLSCGGDDDAGAFFAVTVDAQGPRNQELTLTTLWTGVYISGGASGDGGEE